MLQARLRKTFPPRPDSAGFSLDLEFQAAAGVTVLFGPSGSGKTLTLDAIAGFMRPDEGRILLDDEMLFDGATGVHLPPQARNCGYVFQNYALFPHMTLRENLDVRGGAPAAPGAASPRERNAREVPADRSGGPASARGFRRAAPALLHRARVDRRAPSCLLLDEPTPGPGRSAARRILRSAAPGPRGFQDAHAAGDARSGRVLRAGRRDADSARRTHRAERHAAANSGPAGESGGRAVAGTHSICWPAKFARSIRAATPAACRSASSNWTVLIFRAG